jgi:rubrerythrin
VNKQVYESKNLPEVPERRPIKKQQRAYGTPAPAKQESSQSAQEKPAAAQTPMPQPTVKKKLWYCKQCGYVVFREDPPYICPICKAKREMFTEIENSVEFKG